eukprot:3275300-Heterocapsa_arctica.AAC.1
MVCSGVAFGALCHARLARSPAREPLLAAEPQERFPTLRDQDQELTPSLAFRPPAAAAEAA